MQLVKRFAAIEFLRARSDRLLIRKIAEILASIFWESPRGFVKKPRYIREALLSPPLPLIDYRDS